TGVVIGDAYPIGKRVRHRAEPIAARKVDPLSTSRSDELEVGAHVVLPDRLTGPPSLSLGEHGETSVTRDLLGAVREIEIGPDVARTVLKRDGSRHSDPFVALERGREVVADLTHALTEDECILDGLRRSLRLERLHRVRGIAQQR